MVQAPDDEFQAKKRVGTSHFHCGLTTIMNHKSIFKPLPPMRQRQTLFSSVDFICLLEKPILFKSAHTCAAIHACTHKYKPLSTIHKLNKRVCVLQHNTNTRTPMLGTSDPPLTGCFTYTFKRYMCISSK